MRVRQHRGSIIGPLILITIGVLFLLANFGYINTSFWLLLVQFWPLILILLGLELLLGRSWQGQVIVLLVGLLAIAGIVWLTLNPGLSLLNVSAKTETVTESSDGVQSANVSLNPGVGELNVGALGSGSSNWLEATVAHPSSLTLVQDYQVSNGIARLKLDTQGFQVFMGNSVEHWNVSLAPQIPIMLKVDAGVGGTKLDLNALNVTQLNLNTGVGGTEVVMPSHAGTVTANVDGGVGGLTILIPQGVPARIRSHAGIGGANINPARFPRVAEDLYQSAEYAGATDKIDLTVDAGVGGITIP